MTNSSEGRGKRKIETSDSQNVSDLKIQDDVSSSSSTPDSEINDEKNSLEELSPKRPKWLEGLFVKIPKFHDRIEATCLKIKKGEAHIVHSGSLSSAEVALLIAALEKAKPGKIQDLKLEQIYTLRASDPTDNLIAIWNVAKNKVQQLTFSECTLSKAFMDHIQNDLDNKNLNGITVTKLELPKTDIVNFSNDYSP